MQGLAPGLLSGRGRNRVPGAWVPGLDTVIVGGMMMTMAGGMPTCPSPFCCYNKIPEIITGEDERFFSQLWRSQAPVGWLGPFGPEGRLP